MNPFNIIIWIYFNKIKEQQFIMVLYTKMYTMINVNNINSFPVKLYLFKYYRNKYR